jgi:endogenous inhibitor of DNA gyrase (YacG/DUF329 family)
MPSHACPTCGKTIEYRSVADVPSFPFCSERCRLVDLGRWLDEGYVISQPLAPAEKRDAEDDEADETRSPAPNSADEDDDSST